MNGLPASMEADYLSDVDDGSEAVQGVRSASDRSAAVRAAAATQPLTWDVFPRPYCISALPHRDITMQGVRDEGDFRHYQGVWRLQALPGCAPPGSTAMRLTYCASTQAWRSSQAQQEPAVAKACAQAPDRAIAAGETRSISG